MRPRHTGSLREGGKRPATAMESQRRHVEPENSSTPSKEVEEGCGEQSEAEHAESVESVAQLHQGPAQETEKQRVLESVSEAPGGRLWRLDFGDGTVETDQARLSGTWSHRKTHYPSPHKLLDKSAMESKAGRGHALDSTKRSHKRQPLVGNQGRGRECHNRVTG